MFNGLHYNSITTWLKNSFGCRIVKLSIDAGFTCPNRDGSKGVGGCTFCFEGSGRFAAAETADNQTVNNRQLQCSDLSNVEMVCKSNSANIGLSIEKQIQTAKRKWPDEEIKFIAYFQSFTNTYASANYLRELWNKALSIENVVGLAIATRPDCLGPDILKLLDEFNKKTFLWIELGLQTACEKTADKFNRCWKNSDFEDAMENLSKPGIKSVIHIILGLPGEDKPQYISSALYAASFKPFGIKIHMLHLMEGTAMAEQFKTKPFPILTLNEYVESVCSILECIPQEITIHRLTGDAPQDTLIAPEWSRNKHAVLNSIQKEFKRRGTFQGSSCL